MTRKKVVPHKHYVAHTGKLYEIGSAALMHEGGVVSFVGMVYAVPKGQLHGNPDTFRATSDSYLDMGSALMASNQMINDQDGLGECFREDGRFEIK